MDDSERGKWLDEDGYPTSAALVRIRIWPITSQRDIDRLWEFAKSLWYYPDRFVQVDEEDQVDPFTTDCGWYLSTGGWSGNEDVIGALRSNFIFWSLCWRLHLTGGHFWFRIANVIHD